MNETTKTPQGYERIEALYSRHLIFDIESVEDQLGIVWDDVASFDIRPHLLTVKLKSGVSKEFAGGMVSPTFEDQGAPDEIWTYIKDSEGNLREDNVKVSSWRPKPQKGGE